MTPKEFFDAVVEMRKYQRAAVRANSRDKIALRGAKDAEAKIDKEIARVQLLIKEQMKPRLNFEE